MRLLRRHMPRKLRQTSRRKPAVQSVSIVLRGFPYWTDAGTALGIYELGKQQSDFCDVEDQSVAWPQSYIKRIVYEIWRRQRQQVECHTKNVKIALTVKKVCIVHPSRNWYACMTSSTVLLLATIACHLLCPVHYVPSLWARCQWRSERCISSHVTVYVARPCIQSFQW